jgi:hypothetical protein
MIENRLIQDKWLLIHKCFLLKCVFLPISGKSYKILYKNISLPWELQVYTVT